MGWQSRLYLLLLLSSGGIELCKGYDTQVRDLQFTDIDTDEYYLEGLIQWSPPPDESVVDSYDVWIVPDQYQYQLGTPIQGSIPVGTNNVSITPRETRDMGNGNYARWIMVMPFYAEYIWVRLANSAHALIYDASAMTVGNLTVTNVQFSDQDYLEDTIGGPVTWELRPEEDYGFVSQFNIYLADADGNERWLANSSDTNSLSYTIPNGTVATEIFLRVYTANPNGRSDMFESVGFADWIWDPPTTAFRPIFRWNPQIHSTGQPSQPRQVRPAHLPL
eukprot:s98_g7.t1